MMERALRQPRTRSAKASKSLSIGFLCDRLILETDWLETPLTPEEVDQLRSLLTKLSSATLTQAHHLVRGEGCF